MRTVPSALVLSLALTAASAVAGTGDVIRLAAELAAATFDRPGAGRRFALEARVIAVLSSKEETEFAVEDPSGCMTLRTPSATYANLHARVGYRVRASGFINLGKRSRQAYAFCDRLDILSPGVPPPPTRVTVGEFLSGAFDCRRVIISGVVRDVIRDEIDPQYAYVVLNSDGESISIPRSVADPALRTLVPGSTVEAEGVCKPYAVAARRQLGRHLEVTDGRFRILSNARDDPFGVAEIDFSTRARPQDLARLGRRKVTGRILASWRNAALLQTADDRIVGLENFTGDLPRGGVFVEAVGFPESDLYHINLSRVLWRPRPERPAPDIRPVETTADRLLTDTAGQPQFNPFVHGHLIRLRGTVLNLPDRHSTTDRFNLQCGEFVIPVDLYVAPDARERLSVGSEAAVTGICVMECENWRPNAPFPTIRGVRLVIRNPDDITVLRRAPWWTPQRLAVALGALFAILVGSLAWSVLLKRLAERRGRELAQAAIARAESDLKVFERTRLAVELHDSISQYLTGISLAIRAAVRLAADCPDGLRRNLTLATASLDSCRQELRNCLWDLRNRTLDETDLNTAIRQTLEPHLGTAELQIRFNVPRNLFTDKSAHAILHILRELATNAVRHGHATRVKIAGSIEGHRLHFSVCDNGCGFDPDASPGMESGHFGLQGIRERVNQFEGEMRVDSKTGLGTKVAIVLRMPSPTEDERS